MEDWWNDTDKGKTEVLGEKLCHSATLSTINLICADLGSKLGHRGERSTTDRQRHGGTQNDHLCWKWLNFHFCSDTVRTVCVCVKRDS